MALADAVDGATRPSQTITWTRDDGTAEDLTGATITGTLKPRGGTARAVAGDLSVSDAESGVFVWTYDDADVVEGLYEVQFQAAFGSDPTPAKTFVARWYVSESL